MQSSQSRDRMIPANKKHGLKLVYKKRGTRISENYETLQKIMKKLALCG